jgi:hypothetical protein
MEEMSKEISSRWKHLSPNLKIPYMRMAMDAKSTYDVVMKEYRTRLNHYRDETQKRLEHSVDAETRRRYFAGDTLTQNARRKPTTD